MNNFDFLKDGEPQIPPVSLPPPKIKNVGKILTDKIKSLIYWTGSICACISVIAYIIIVVIMSVGFKSTASLSTNLIFALITAFVGILIVQFLKLQGIAFAKSEDEVREVWCRFYKRKTKKRKVRPLKFFWIKSMVFDVIIKAISVIITSIGTVYIFIEASGDLMRILLAVFNLTLFAGFGLMSLTQAYDFTREEHVAWMLAQMEEKENAENVEEKETADSGAGLQDEPKKEPVAEPTVSDSQVVIAGNNDTVFCADDKQQLRQSDSDNPLA